MKTNNKNKLALGSLAIFALAMAQTQAASINVPNGSFETLYKPSQTTITADIGQGWTVGVGAGVGVDGGIATYSDTSTGSAVDVPGWVQSSGVGSVSKQASTTPYGSYFFMANGMGWGDANAGSIKSAAVLATVASSESYTLSVFGYTGYDGATPLLPLNPVVLELLAWDGTTESVIASASAAFPSFVQGTWQSYSKTYDEASLAAYVGQGLKIRVGWAPGSPGEQSQLDNVTLTSADGIPEPASLSLLALGALGLVRRKRH